MTKYELGLLLDPQLKDEAGEKLIEDLKKEIDKTEGKVAKIDAWGKKDLAYPIKKAKEGIYFILNLELPEEYLGEFGKKLRLNEKILRYLLVRLE